VDVALSTIPSIQRKELGKIMGNNKGLMYRYQKGCPKCGGLMLRILSSKKGVASYKCLNINHEWDVEPAKSYLPKKALDKWH